MIFLSLLNLNRIVFLIVILKVDFPKFICIASNGLSSFISKEKRTKESLRFKQLIVGEIVVVVWFNLLYEIAKHTSYQTHSFTIRRTKIASF